MDKQWLSSTVKFEMLNDTYQEGTHYRRLNNVKSDFDEEALLTVGSALATLHDDHFNSAEIMTKHLYTTV